METDSETTGTRGQRNRNINTRATSIVIEGENLEDDLTLTTVPESPDGILALGELLSMLHSGKSLGDCLRVLMNRSDANSSDEYKEQDPREIVEDEEFQTVMEMWNKGRSVPQILSAVMSQEQSSYVLKGEKASSADDRSIASNPDDIIALGALIEMAKDGLCGGSARGRHADPCDLLCLRRDGSWDTDRRDTMFDSSDDEESTGSDTSGDSMSYDEDDESEIRRETVSKANRTNITRYLWKRRKTTNNKSRYTALTGVEAVMDESMFEKKPKEPTAPTNTDANADTDISTNKKNRTPNLLSKMRGRSFKGTNNGDDVNGGRKRSKSPAFSNLNWRMAKKTGAEYESMKGADFDTMEKMKPTKMSARSHTSHSESTQPTSGGGGGGSSGGRRLSGGSILQDLKASDTFDDILKDLETSDVEKHEKSHGRSDRDLKDQPIARGAKTQLNNGKDGAKKPASILKSKRNVSDGTKNPSSRSTSEFEPEVAKSTEAAVIRNVKEEHDMNGQEVQLAAGSLPSELQVTLKGEPKESNRKSNKQVGTDSGKKQSQARRKSVEKVAKKLLVTEADKPTPKDSAKSSSQTRKLAEKVFKKKTEKPTPKSEEMSGDSVKCPNQTKKSTEKVAKKPAFKESETSTPNEQITSDLNRRSIQSRKLSGNISKMTGTKESDKRNSIKRVSADSSRTSTQTGKSSGKTPKKLGIKQSSDMRGEETKNGAKAQIPLTSKTSKKAAIIKEESKIQKVHEAQVDGVRSKASETKSSPKNDVTKPTPTRNGSTDTNFGNESPRSTKKVVDKATMGLATNARPDNSSSEVSGVMSSKDLVPSKTIPAPPNTVKSSNTGEPKAIEKSNPSDLSIFRSASMVSSVGQEVELNVKVGGSIEPLVTIPEQNVEGADDNVPSTNRPSAAGDFNKDASKNDATNAAIKHASNERRPARQEATFRSERQVDETEQLARKETPAIKKKTVPATRSIPSLKDMPFSKVIQELKLSKYKDKKDSSKTPELKEVRPPIKDTPSGIGQELELATNNDKVSSSILPETKTDPVARSIPPITSMPSSVGQELELISSKASNTTEGAQETKATPVAPSSPIPSKASKATTDTAETKATPVALAPPIPLSSMPSAVGQEIELVRKAVGKTNRTATPEANTADAPQAKLATVSESTEGVPSVKTTSDQNVDNSSREKQSTELATIGKVDGALSKEDAKSEQVSYAQFDPKSVGENSKASADLEQDTNGHLVKPKAIDNLEESTRSNTGAEKVETETRKDHVNKSFESSAVKADPVTPKRNNLPKFLSGIGFSRKKSWKASTKAEDYAMLESDDSLDEPTNALNEPYDLSNMPSSIGQEVVVMRTRAPTLAPTTESLDEKEKLERRTTTQDESIEENKESDTMPPTALEEGDDCEAAKASSAAMKEDIKPPEGGEITLGTNPKEEAKAKQGDVKSLETKDDTMKEEVSPRGPNDGAETKENDEPSLPSRSQSVSAVDDDTASNQTQPSEVALVSPKPERSSDNKTAEVVSNENGAGTDSPTAIASACSDKTAKELARDSLCTGDATFADTGAAAGKAETSAHQDDRFAKHESKDKSQEVKLKLVSETDVAAVAAANTAESTSHQKERVANQESEEKSQEVKLKLLSSQHGSKKAKRKSGFGRMVKRVLKGKKDAEEEANNGERADKTDAVASNMKDKAEPRKAGPNKSPKAPNRLLRRVFKGKKRRRNTAGVEKLASIPESGEEIVKSSDDRAVLNMNSSDANVGMGAKNEEALNVTPTEEKIEEKSLEPISNMTSNHVNTATKEVPATTTVVSSNVDADATRDRAEVDYKEGSRKEKETVPNEPAEVDDKNDGKVPSQPPETTLEDIDNSVHSATALATVSSFTLRAISSVSSIASEASNAVEKIATSTPSGSTSIPSKQNVDGTPSGSTSIPSKQNANSTPSDSSSLSSKQNPVIAPPSLTGSVGATSFTTNEIGGVASFTTEASTASSISSKISHNEETGVGVFLNSGAGDDEFETCFDTEDDTNGQTPFNDSEMPRNSIEEEGITKKVTDDSSENSKTQARDDKENNGCATEIKRTMATPLATREVDSKQDVGAPTSPGNDFEPTATLVTVPELKLGDGGIEYKEKSFVRLQM